MPNRGPVAKSKKKKSKAEAVCLACGKGLREKWPVCRKCGRPNPLRRSVAKAAVVPLFVGKSGRPRCPRCLTTAGRRGQRHCVRCGSPLLQAVPSASEPLVQKALDSYDPVSREWYWKAAYPTDGGIA